MVSSDSSQKLLLLSVKQTERTLHLVALNPKNKIMTTGILGIIVSILFNCSPVIQKDTTLPEILRNIPTGIEVSHSKKNVYAIQNKKDPEKYGKYKWHFETTVSSINDDLTIIEFGAYLWDGNEWVSRSIYNRPFNQNEFSKWYSCENALIKKGHSFTDFNNWTKGDSLDGEKKRTLWYFIGVNADGEKYKGTAEVLTIGELEQ